MSDKAEHPPVPEAFAALGVRPSILRALAEAKFTTPSEIQALLIPRALAGVDLLGQARTGTGKTAAFGIPILSKCTRGTPTQAIILVPTRELAVQVDAEMKRLGQYTPIRSVPVYGGQKIVAQLKFLKNHPEILIGTPGRVIDLLDRRIINFENIRFVVLDEVDRMLDIGFRDDIRNILSRVKGVREKAERAASRQSGRGQRDDRGHRDNRGQRDERGSGGQGGEASGQGDAPRGEAERDDEYRQQRAEVKAAEAELLVEHTGTHGGDRPIDGGVADASKEGPSDEAPGQASEQQLEQAPGRAEDERDPIDSRDEHSEQATGSRSHQTIFVSATISDEIDRLARRYMREPVEKLIAPGADDKPTVENVEQYYFSVGQWDKYRLLRMLLERENPDLAIVFCRTKRGAEKIAKRLHADGIECREIHGNLAQNKRDRVMKGFRNSKFDVLVATDLASRGIDVADISHIINFDIPEDPEAYVHRIGRTARMGAAGKAFTFVTREQGDELTKVEALINMVIPLATVEGFEPNPTPADWTAEKPGFGPSEPGKPVQSRFERRYGAVSAPAAPEPAPGSEAPAAGGAPPPAPVTLQAPPRTLGSKIPINRRHKRRR